MTDKKVFVPTDEAKGKAKRNRVIAIILWLLAIGGEVYAIMELLSDEMMTWLIVTLVGILILSLIGSYLWKKANHLDPASEKDKFRFFVQNQLGSIMAVIAFLPLVIFIFANKDTSKKTKGITGAIAIVALLVASIAGYDFNPASIEKYTEQINEQTDLIEQLNDGVDRVYWTNHGNKYHIYEDCYHIKNREKHGGTVKEAWEARGIGDNELCLTCKRRAMKEKNLELEDLQKKAEAVPVE